MMDGFFQLNNNITLNRQYFVKLYFPLVDKNILKNVVRPTRIFKQHSSGMIKAKHLKVKDV